MGEGERSGRGNIQGSRFGGILPLFFIFIIFNIHSYNYAFNHPLPLAEGRHLVFSSLLRSARETSMGCRDENRTRACRTASRRTTNWATPHPAELRCTQLSNAATHEQRRTPNEQRRTNIHCTVIRFVSTSAKFSICTISWVIMGHLLKLKCVHSRVPTSAYFDFDKCPIKNHDGANDKFSTNWDETDYSVFIFVKRDSLIRVLRYLSGLWR
jgi:hypothetical protein